VAGAGRPARRADALVLDLDSRAGLSIVRTLARAGLRVAGASKDPSASGLRTRYAVERTILPDPEADFNGFVDALVGSLAARPADGILASTDWSVEAMQRNRELIGRFSAPALGAPEAVDIALDKERTLALAKTLGIAIPRSVKVSSPAELIGAVGEVGTPCVLKPVSSWQATDDGGSRLSPLYAVDPAGAEEAATALLGPRGAAVLVQEVVGGTRETIKLFRSAGRTLVRFAMTIDRTWPPLGGSSVMRRSISPPEDALLAAERLVAEIDLDGYSEVEFRRGPDGVPVLMEVNPRLSQSVELAIRAGVDFPRMQLEWARGGRIPEPAAPVLGVRVGWLGGEVRLVAGALRGSPPPRPRLSPELRSLFSDYVLHGSRIEGLDIRDLRPTLGALGSGASALFGGSVRRPGTRRPSASQR
jgi:predicted ATP-grasp superfamily ATP-dependent carboligase